MTSTNDGRDVKSNQSSGQKGKSYYIELYKSLDARLSGDCDLGARTRHLCEAWRRVHSLCLHALPATHPHLFSWIEKHTARTILQTEWQSPTSKEEQTSLKEAIDAFIAEAESGAASKDGVQLSWEIQLQQRGEWFQSILCNPWGHDVLRALLQGESPGEDEILGWLKEERGVMFVTRLKQLTASKSKCDDLAMGLVTTVMDRVRASTVLVPDNEQAEEPKDKPAESSDQPTFGDILKAEAGFTMDIWELLTDIEFVLLHKCDRHSKCIELAKQIPLRNGYHLVERLQSRLETAPREKRLWKNAKDVATLVAQVIIARCMVVPVCSAGVRSALYCCSRSLARLLLPARLPAAAAALAAPAATARHLHTLAQAVDAQLQPRNSSSMEMIPFVCELYVRAITAGMNELERLKLKTEKEAEARASEATLSAWFTQLGTLLACSERVRCECALTAFSVHPTADMYDKIRAAPLLPRLPAARDTQETTGEATSEFGSWTTDSRTQSNLVKTSETLNIKHTRNQANVLSTALLTEGEAIGLSPELCQDLAVLLSGPRVKTLSWDMDREVLLENCRVYMERTHGGTRALTTELKYLNLDPSSYMHLPEEKDEEDDLYYGIEKGYEHLVELQEPESAWQDPLEDPEVTESACSSSMENDNFVVRRKKNTKPDERLSDSEEDSDPLSLIAEVKRTEKKKERPHSKERSSKDSSKERKKKTKSKETSDNKEGSRERRKENPENKDKEKKKEKKPRKKKVKDSQQVETKPASLSSLIGMKVAKVKKPEGKHKKSPDMKGMPYVTDSDYDSQGRSSLASLNSEGNDPDVLFDGLFCMEEYGSPENDPLSVKNSLSNSELSVANGRVTINTAQQVKKPKENKPAPQIKQYSKNNQAKSKTSHLNNVQSTQTSVEPTQSEVDHKTQVKNVNAVREQVKKSISRLIEFRRQNSLLEAQRKSMSSPSSTASSPRVITESIPALYKSPNAIVRNDPPLIISPKALVVPDIPKLYINKTQTESEPAADMNAKHQNKPVIQYPNRYTQPQTANYSDAYLQSLKPQENVQPAKPQPSAFNYTQSSISNDIAQKNFQAFLKELQETINAGTGAKKEAVPPVVPNMPQKKDIRPISRVTPVVPKNMKPEPGTSSQCAKSTIPTAKKADNQLNTFARLSYMHKTKQSDLKTSKESLLSYQDQMSNLNRSIDEQKSAKLKYLQSKGDLVVSRVSQAPHNLSMKDEAKVHIKKVDNPSKTVIRDHPTLSNILQTNTTYGAIPKQLPKQDNSVRNSLHQIDKPRAMTAAPVPRESSLSEKDQNDLLLLLRQQNKLNYPSTYINPDVNKITNNIQYSNNPVPASTIPSHNQPPILNIPAKKNYSTEIKHINTQNYDCSNKATLVEPVHGYSKSVESKPDNTKSIPYNKINVSITKVPNVATNNAEFNQFNQYGLNKQETKCNVPEEQELNHQDWESVMDALLKHKTPRRAPNVLEMRKETLTKEGLSNSSLRNQRIMRTNIVVDSEAKTNERLQTQTVLKHTTSESLLRPNVVVEGTKAVENKRQHTQTAKHVMPDRVVRPSPTLNTEAKPTLQTQRIVRPSSTIDAEVKTGDNKTHTRTVPKHVMPERTVRPTILCNAEIKRSDHSKLQAYTPAKQVMPEKVNPSSLIFDAEVKISEVRKAPNIIRNVTTERIVRPSLNFNASLKPDERTKVQHIHTTDKIVRPNLVSQVKIDDPVIVAKHVMPAVIHKKTSMLYLATEDSLKNHKQPQTQTQAVKPQVLGEQIKRTEVPKKQVANTFVKDKDCYISGIPNSDYDLLDELMDDELRQEIGELSSDEETYRASSANNLKGNKICKDPNVVKNTKEQDSLHAVDLRCALKPAQGAQNSVIIQANKQPVKCNSTPKVIIECDRTIVPPRFTDAQRAPVELQMPQVQQNTSRPLATNIMQQPTANAVVLNNQTNENKAYICQNINRTHINVVDPRNVIITAVPQPVIPKVVLLSSDIVYDPFTTVQTHLQAGLCNVNQTPYVTLNAAPNITLYQTTQFTAPIVNEVIIGNATTMPIPAAASEKITSMSCNSQDIMSTTQTIATDPTETIKGSSKEAVSCNSEDIMLTTQTIATDPTETIKGSSKEAVSSDQNVSNNVSLETKPKIIVDHLLRRKPDVVEPKSSLDINFNKNCERKVLSEVQDKQKFNLIEKVDVKNVCQKLVEEKAEEKVTIQTEFKLEREHIVVEHAPKNNLKDHEREPKIVIEHAPKNNLKDHEREPNIVIEHAPKNNLKDHEREPREPKFVIEHAPKNNLKDHEREPNIVIEHAPKNNLKDHEREPKIVIEHAPKNNLKDHEREPKIVIEHAPNNYLRDHERLKKKRLAILNSEANHRSCADPIPLGYAPLFKPIQPSHISNKTPSQHKADNAITPNLVLNNHKVNEEANTNDSKENEEKKTPCRRIMLRSSNNLKAVTGSLSSQDQRNPVGRKTKVRLKKTEEQCSDKTVEQKVHIDNVDVHKNEKIESPIRMSKRILNKKVERNKTEVISTDIVESVVINQKQKKNSDNNPIQNTLKDVKHADKDENKIETDGLKKVDNTDINKLIEITAVCKPVDNKPEVMQNISEFDVIDIEDALQGSKIPKVTVRPENDNNIASNDGDSRKTSSKTEVEKKTNKRKKATKKRTGRVVREVQSDIKNLETKSKDIELSTNEANKSIKKNDTSNDIIETKSSTDNKLKTNDATKSIKKIDTSNVIIETKSSKDNKINTNDATKSTEKNDTSNVIIVTKSSTDNKFNTNDANKSIKKNDISNVIIETKSSTDNKLNTNDANKSIKKTDASTVTIVPTPHTSNVIIDTKSSTDNKFNTNDANKSIKKNDISNVIIETKSSTDNKLNTNDANKSIKKTDASTVTIDPTPHTSNVIIDTKSSTDKKLNINDANKSIKKNDISNVNIETKSSTDNKLNTNDANKFIKKTDASTVTIVPTPLTALGGQIESISILDRAIKAMQTINKNVLPIVQTNKDKSQKKLVKQSEIVTVKEIINLKEPLSKSSVVKEARKVKTPQTKRTIDLVKTVEANNTYIIANGKNKQSIAPTSKTINVPHVTNNTTELLGPLIEGKGKNLSNNNSQISKPEQNSYLPVKANILASNVSNNARNNIINNGKNSIIQNKTLNQDNQKTSKNGDLSGNSQTQKNEQSTLESLRDQIRIEEFPALANEPDKKCVRIKMPNGKSFKATVYGKMHVSFESLFSDQSLRMALLNSINNTKRYTVNIKQVSTAQKNDPSKIVETRIEEVNVQTNFSESIETVNLLSDDEDESPSQTYHKTQTLKTASGEFNISSLDEAEFNKHKNKLQQKCLIKLTDIKTSHPHLLPKESVQAAENIIPAESENNPNQSDLSSSLSVVQDEVKRTQLPIDVNDTIKDNCSLPIVPEQESVPPQSLDKIVVPDLPAYFNPDVIEIDDSSNDSVPEAREVPLSLCSEPKTKELVLADCSIKELPGDIDNLKTLLLKDLGVDDIVSNIKKPKHDDSSIKLLKDTTNQSCMEKIRECYVKLHNCDDLVKKYDQIKIINQKCTVSLHRCDDLLEKDNISVDEDLHNLSDDFINLDSLESEPKLTRSGSFSLLDDISIFEEEILDISSQVIDCGRSSPVMEVFDTISSLRKATLATEDHFSVMEAFDLIACLQKPIRKVVTEQIRCFCDWYPTKRDLHLSGKEELLLEAQPSIKNIPLFYESTFNSYIDKKSNLVPTLKKLTANLFLENTIIDQIRPYHIKNVEPIQSPSHSLKRKIRNGEDKSVASKLVKVMINTNVQDIKIEKVNTSQKETAENESFVWSKIQDDDRNLCVTSTTLDENVTQIEHPSVDQAPITNIDNSQSSKCVDQGEDVNSEAATVHHSNDNSSESDVQNNALNEDPDDSRAENDEKFPTKIIHNNKSTGPADMSKTEVYDTTKYENLVENVSQLHSDNTHVINIEETKPESIERISSPEIVERLPNAGQNENDSNTILDHLVEVNEDKLIVENTLTDTIQALDAVPKCKLAEANATYIENCNEVSAISGVKDEGDVSPDDVTRQIDGIGSNLHTANNSNENIEENEIQNYSKRPCDSINSDNIENEVEEAAIETVSSEKMEQPNLIVNTQENLTESDNDNTLVRQCNIELIECKEVNTTDLENVHSLRMDATCNNQSDNESKTSDVAKPVVKSDNNIVNENMSHLTETSETCLEPKVSSETQNIINYDSNQDSTIVSNEYQTDSRKLALTDKELNKEDSDDSRSENKASTNTIDESHSKIDISKHHQSDDSQSHDHQCTKPSTDIEVDCNKDISGIRDNIPEYQESEPVSGNHNEIRSHNHPELELMTVVEVVSDCDSSVDCSLQGSNNTAQTDCKLSDDELENIELEKSDDQEIESNNGKVAKSPKKDSNIKTHENRDNNDIVNEELEIVERVIIIRDEIGDSQDDDSQNSDNLIKHATSVKVDPTTELEFLATSPEKGALSNSSAETQPSPNHKYSLKELYLKEKTVINESKLNNEFILNGIEYEDPEVGTCYVFPIADTSSSSCDTDEIFEEETEEIIQVIQEISEDGTVASLTLETKEMSADEDYFKLNLPKLTYSRLRNSDTYMKASRRPLKRKIDMSDVKISEKKYRKGKNIDYPKITVTAMADSAYGREFKRVLDYCSTLKFSFSQPYHKECIDVDEIVRNWPIGLSICDDLQGEFHDAILFTDLDNVKPHKVFDPEDQSLADEISAEYSECDLPSNTPETNFSMGFGEGSDRVIQNLEEVGDDSKFSAATLSDVKQTQPFLLSENYNECKADQEEVSVKTIREDQIKQFERYLTYIQMRDKVRSFFKKTSMELKYDWIRQEKRSNKYDVRNFPFELYNTPDFLEPPLTNVVVQVVQVGQLPVSAAAQNPVTCDPRVTQVSDASPSQCSVENSPQDDSQPTIKTEYTELTTADLTVPLMQEYAQHNQTLPMDSQEPTDMSITGENIPIETEIKSVVKIELVDDTEEKDEPRDNYENCEPPLLEAKQENDVDYSFDTNSDHVTPPLEAETDYHVDMMDYPQEKQDVPETYPVQEEEKQQNGAPEKTDQIAHAMNAAGITTTSETMTNNTRAHALVNLLSQKLRQAPSGAGQATNTYSKTTSINAMALQQALAQILPPPLNQTNGTENNQQAQNTPQVLHIVQGKNASGSQITLVDNTQQSVINAPNATPVLHIVQNKSGTANATTNGSGTAQTNSFGGLSLVDAGLQQGGNQLLHIVNTGSQKNSNAAGQLLKRVNLLTNLANVQGSNEQKMVQFVCKSADGKAIQLNAPHQRSMVLRLQPIETPNVQATPPKPVESQDLSPTSTATNSLNGKDAASQQEIKSRSVYEENYAKFIQNSSSKTGGSEKSTSLPKFNQAFGKPVFQDGNPTQNDINANNSHLSVNTKTEPSDCQATDNAINLDHIGQISSPPLLLRKSPAQTSQPQPNLVQQLKQTITPMNIQTMHGGVIYTRQIPVNIGGGQTINLITVPSTELVDDSAQKQQPTQNDMEQSIIKLVPQNQSAPPNAEISSEEGGAPMNVSNENNQNPQPQPVLTQMRIKLPMLSKAPQMVSGARVVRPSFFQIQRNVIGGTNQPVYQQLVLTAAPPLGQQTIRLPQAQTARQIKVDNQSSAESQMSSSTLEQLREFDMVLEQVKERSSVPPNSSSTTFPKLHTPSTDTTDGSASSSSTETTQQVLYSIGNNHQPLNVAYVNRKATVTTPTTSTFVRSPDSSGIIDSPTSSSHVQIPHTVTSESSHNDPPPQPKPKSKSKSRPKSSSNPPNTLKLNTVPPKTSTQKPLEDEQTTQRILYILAEYKEQVENSPDKDKPAPRRRSNPPSNPSGSSKRKKSSSGSRRHGRDISPIHGEDTCRTMGSEDSSCGTSQGDCNESCLESHSPQDSPRKVVRKLTFEQETPAPTPRPQPQRNVIVADGQTITVARGTTGKPATAVLMPANYILPVSMVKGGQQIAIVTNRGPKLLTVGGGEGGATNALLLQRLIGPAGLKPVLARPGVRHVRLPTAALHNLQAFNLATATTIQPPDSTASPAPAPTPPELVDTRATSSPWTDRDCTDVKPERGSSPEGSEPWNLPSSGDPHDYSYEETVRADHLDRTVLDPIPDRYSPDMEAQRIFDKMFDVESKKSYMGDSPRCAYDIDASDCDDKPYHQVVQKKDGSSHRQHRLTHVSAAALRHKYAILEHELRLQKSLSEECEDLGVDSPSASELFPEAELLFAASPAHDHTQDQGHHSHTPQPTLMNQSGIPHPDMDDQIATDQLLTRDVHEDQQDLNLGLEDVGIVTVSEDGMQATIALDQEEFARSHPNTTFHSEPEEGEVQPFTITGLKGRHIPTIFHSNRAPATVLMTAPQTTVISQATGGHNHSEAVKYADIDNMINSLPSSNNNINLSSVLVKDEGLTRFDSILNDSRELHLSNTASAIVHSAGNATQVIRRVCYDDDKRDRFLMDEPDGLIAGDDAKMIAEDSSRDATLESMGGDVDDDRSSPERHAELFWESNSASERSESRRPLDFSSDSEKCCKSPSYDETNSTDSSGVGTHMRLDSVIKDARGIERSGSADGSSADDTHPPLRTYPPKRMYGPLDNSLERSLTGKTRAGEIGDLGVEREILEARGGRRASGRGVVKRGCHCCNGSPAPPKPKKSRQRKPTMDFTTN